MALQWLEQFWFEYLPFGRGSDKRRSGNSDGQKAVATVELNSEGLITSINDRFAQLLGARSEELQGRHYNSLMDATFADSNQVKEHWGFVSRGESKTIDLKLNRKDKEGGFVWVQAICNPVMDRNGKLQRINVLHVDLTALMNIRDEALKIKSAIENAQTAIMMVNRDFVVTYVNKETMVLLKRHEDLFRRMWPGFEANKIVGTCIDCFHKNPQHQRTMLADPKRLPYRTEIKVGEVVLSLTVSAQIDTSGNYVGNTLEWADVTQVRKEAAETYADFQSQLNAISRAQAVIEFTLDGTIVNANENFLRVTGYTLDEIKGRHHSIFMKAAKATKTSTVASGPIFVKVKRALGITNASPKTASKSGFVLRTIRFWMPKENRPRSSSTHRIFRKRRNKKKRSLLPSNEMPNKQNWWHAKWLKCSKLSTPFLQVILTSRYLNSVMTR